VRVERFQVGPLENNLYLLTTPGGHDAIVVDPSIESEDVLRQIEARGLRIQRILLTHAHIDHILMVKPFHDRTGAPVWLNAEDRFLYDRGLDQADQMGMIWPGTAPIAHWITDGEEVGIPGIAVRAVRTPGHSPGSVTFVTEEGLIAGDVLFRGSVGRTDLPGGDWATLVKSIRELVFAHPPETVVFPGHGPVTTVGDEMKTNPFVGQSAFERA
jgi:glyoxylase-like metal-dependent hydrolase (beta-lactamase superfamily II)